VSTTSGTPLVRLVRDEHGGLGVAEPMCDPVVAVQNRHREEQRTKLPGAEKDCRRLGSRGQDDRDAVATDDPIRLEEIGGPVRELLQFTPRQLALYSVEPLVDHRELVRGMLVAAVLGDVVARRYAPLVLRANVLVTTHDRPPSLARIARRRNHSSLLRLGFGV
jgi:hypothetical protein